MDTAHLTQRLSVSVNNLVVYILLSEYKGMEMGGYDQIK
jgi:hypothetical protein